MIFAHTWQWLLEASPNTGQVKTQTRRLVKLGDDLDLNRTNPTVYHHDRIVYQAGKDYAVTSGRTKPTIWWAKGGAGLFVAINVHRDNHQQFIDEGFKPLRIRITDIKREDVCTISAEDARAEGFANFFEFMRVWCEMHDKPLYSAFPRIEESADNLVSLRQQYLEDKLWAYAKERPAERYQAWKLTFEVVR